MIPSAVLVIASKIETVVATRNNDVIIIRTDPSLGVCETN